MTSVPLFLQILSLLFEFGQTAMETTNWEDAEVLLREVDSPERYSPVGFDIDREAGRAIRLSNELSQATELKATIDKADHYQDGALFTVISLKNAETGAEAAKVLISSFGRLVMVDVDEPRFAHEILDTVSSSEYRYVPTQYLERDYTGEYQDFCGLSWRFRYFCMFY